jgi:uncharacterized membrane protein
LPSPQNFALRAQTRFLNLMSKDHASPARLEAFSDGVIAVIITIMVLELKVPHDSGLAGFVSILPTLGVYALSFAFTAVYWINHHHLVHRTDEADERILYANLLFLFCLSLLPFFTAYVLEKKMDSFSVGLYLASMILTSFGFLLLRLSIGQYLRDAAKLQREDAAAERKHWISLFVYLVDIGLSFRHPHIALAVVALVSLLWVIPNARVVPHVHCEPPNAPTPDI